MTSLALISKMYCTLSANQKRDSEFNGYAFFEINPDIAFMLGKILSCISPCYEMSLAEVVNFLSLFFMTCCLSEYFESNTARLGRVFSFYLFSL